MIFRCPSSQTDLLKLWDDSNECFKKTNQTNHQKTPQSFPKPIESSDPLTKDMLNLNWNKKNSPINIEFLTLWWQGDLNKDFIN